MWSIGETFQKNFFDCWQEKFNAEEKKIIKELSKCNFSTIYDYLIEVREKKKEEKKEKSVKLALKAETDRCMSIYSFALVDGYLEKVGNFRVEPPALFRGRGKHPKTGMLKKRVQPEDVTINVSKGSTIPAVKTIF